MVSVIVPVYKSEQTLERCVNSLLMQDYDDIEILLIVDGPPDGSGILADKLAKTDDRIRVINQTNQGVSESRRQKESISVFLTAMILWRSSLFLRWWKRWSGMEVIWSSPDFIICILGTRLRKCRR